MACCILAAFLIAQMMETLRRWGMFWGFVRVPKGEEVDTIYARLGRYFRRSNVRRALAVMTAVEVVALGAWLYTGHLDHIAQLADIAWSGIHGERVMYASQCGVDGRSVATRFVLADIPTTRRN